MNKKIKIIFTLSFILNITLMGVVLGGMYKSHQRHSMKNIDEPIKQVLRKNMEYNRTDMQVKRDLMKQYKKELRDIIVAPEFDRVAFDASMNKIFEVQNGMSQGKAIVFGDTLAELSQKDRKALSSKVLSHLSGKRHGQRKGRKHMKNKEKMSN